MLMRYQVILDATSGSSLRLSPSDCQQTQRVANSGDKTLLSVWGVRATSMRLIPPRPNILNHADSGHLTAAVLVALPHSAESSNVLLRTICYLDLRAICIGVVWQFAPDGRFDQATFLRHLAGHLPAGYDIILRRRQGDLDPHDPVVQVQQGELLTASLRLAAGPNVADQETAPAASDDASSPDDDSGRLGGPQPDMALPQLSSDRGHGSGAAPRHEAGASGRVDMWIGPLSACSLDHGMCPFTPILPEPHKVCPPAVRPQEHFSSGHRPRKSSQCHSGLGVSPLSLRS